jgi:hypothetical protein
LLIAVKVANWSERNLRHRDNEGIVVFLDHR